MEPLQEILETVREIRKGQLEALEWRRRYIRKARIIWAVILILLVAYLVWAMHATRS